MKEKRERVPVNWHKELRLLPGYIVVILWVLFTFVLLGWYLQPAFLRLLISSRIGCSPFRPVFILKTTSKPGGVKCFYILYELLAIPSFRKRFHPDLRTGCLCPRRFAFKGKAHPDKLCFRHGRSGHHGRPCRFFRHCAV